MIAIAKRAVLLVLLIVNAEVFAAARASLQPVHIALGQTTTLTVETDVAAEPDFSVLDRDFVLRGRSSSTQTTIRNGSVATRTLFGIELEPRAAGVITIPAITVGNEQTAPIILNVDASAPASAGNGDAIYFETELATHEPYVQQAVLYTVRLYYAIALLNGGVDVRAPADASLQQLGEDRNYQRAINGQRYEVFERSYLLIPEKSGALLMPAPQFRGRARSNDINAFFDNGRAVSLAGQGETLNVRPQPAAAPQPWLAASALRLSHGALPDKARSTEPLLLEITLAADGVMAAQLPELVLPGIAGAQIFPEPPQSKDAMVAGQLRATLTRRFAIVPAQPGVLRIPELRVGYWNTQKDQADAAVLAAFNVEVTPGTNAALQSAARAGSNAGAVQQLMSGNADQAAARPWQLLTAVLALALMAALWWGWRRGQPLQTVPMTQGAGRKVALDSVTLQRALAGNDLRAIAEALQGTSTPASTTLGALQARLADAIQRDAVADLDRAMWAAGVTDHTQLLAKLRAAFRGAPSFAVDATAAGAELLPPLYPRR